MKDLDSYDLKLLYWLDLNSRSTNKQVAKKIGLSEQAVAYRMQRLEGRGIIINYVAFINTLSLGYTHYKVYLKLHNATEAQEKELIEFLVRHAHVRWVVRTSGRYDLSFSLLAKTPSAFDQAYQEIEQRFGSVIIERNILMNLRSPGFSRAWLLDKKDSVQLEYSASDSVQTIDETDHKILRCISQHARENTVTIAQKLSLSVDIVKYRLKKLVEKNIINGYTVQLNLGALGYEYYSIFVHLHNAHEFEKWALSFARMHPNILYVVKLLGNYDAQLELEVKDYAELEENLRAFREHFSAYIRDFEILRVTKEYKYNFYPFS